MLGSDCAGQFVERGGDCEAGEGVDTEFVMAPSEVLNERMPPGSRSMRFRHVETAHRSQSGLQSCVVGFDPVVGRVAGFDGYLEHFATGSTRWEPMDQ